MAGSRVGLFDNLNIPIHRDAQHREDVGFGPMGRFGAGGRGPEVGLWLCDVLRGRTSTVYTTD